MSSCVVCGKVKKIHGHGKCNSCYFREYNLKNGKTGYAHPSVCERPEPEDLEEFISHYEQRAALAKSLGKKVSLFEDQPWRKQGG